jgi:hypothetical protein
LFEGGCGTGPKCEFLLKQIEERATCERASTLLKVLADHGCDIEELASRLMTLAEWDRKNRHYAETKPEKLRRLAAELRWCSGEMRKLGVTDAIENFLVLSKTESPDLIHALNFGLFPLSGKDEPRGSIFHKLPEWMLEIAKLLDKGLEETRKLNSQRSYWGFVDWVVAQVKRETKREHYEKVSELLDLLLEAKGKKPIGPELFKKSIQRHRKLGLLGRTAKTKRKKNR